jgi:hypothetical protein
VPRITSGTLAATIRKLKRLLPFANPVLPCSIVTKASERCPTKDLRAELEQLDDGVVMPLLPSRCAL